MSTCSLKSMNTHLILDIAVNDAAVMQILDSRRNLTKDFCGFFLCQPVILFNASVIVHEYSRRERAQSNSLKEVHGWTAQ